MDAVFWWFLGLLTGLVCWVARRQRERRTHNELLARLRAELADCKRVPERAAWHAWWLRNAAETPMHDPGRLHLLRFAIAAQLAPSLETLQRDLQRLSADSDLPGSVRVHAAALAGELDAPEAPWTHYLRHHSGKPLHSAQAVAQAYRDALTSWTSLLGVPVAESQPPGSRPIPPGGSS